MQAIVKVPGLYYKRFDVGELAETGLTEVIDYVQQLNYVIPAPSGRKVVQFGPIYDYETRQVKEQVLPIPLKLAPLLNVVNEALEEVKLPPQAFNQCIINLYKPGEGIAAHTDHPTFGPIIVCFTANSGRIIQFRGGDEKVELYTHPNSLYIMAGPARKEFSHCMPPRLNDVLDGKKIPRGISYSITLRTVPKN